MIKKIQEVQGRMAQIRRRRRRCLDFAYGRQWGDTVRTNSGRVMSEGAWMRRQGRIPITNNLIQRVIKGVVGYWEQYSDRSGTDRYKNLDTRTLQEMMISGMAVQRVGAASDPLLPDARTVSPEYFFCDNFAEPSLLGATYQFASSVVVEAFAQGSPTRALELMRMFEGKPDVNLIEVWAKLDVYTLSWHDPEHGILCHTECTQTHLQDVERLSKHRTEMGKPALKTRFKRCQKWEQQWMTEQGEVLHSREYDTPETMPYVVAVCDGLDEEVHSPVEGLIEQQKYINRLVSTLDSVISHSAKGVLLYPSDQLPRGMTWKEIRNLWDNPGSILPFSPTRKGLLPTQIHASGRLDGAMQMLMLQMKMFDDMAGVDSATSGARSTATGSEMLKAGIEQNRMVLRDLLTAFDDLLRRRNAKCSMSLQSILG